MVKIDSRKIRIIRHAICYFVALLVLFIISYKNFLNSRVDYIGSLSVKNNINTEIVSPKELFYQSLNLIKENYVDPKLNKNSVHYWKHHYADKIETEDDVYVAINSFIASLNDPYSKFLSKSEFETQNNSIDAKAKGIGINIASVSGKIYIMNVLRGTPADIAGLKRGDIILQVDNFNIKGKTLFQTIQHMKGPLGTTLDITVLRGDKKISKKIRREEINIKSLEYKTLENNIGYIQISSFISKDFPMDFISALDSLRSTNALIIDVRGNTGGLFQNAIFASDVFLKKGKILQVLDNNRNINIYTADRNNVLYTKPLVIIIDKDSASASEILAGALKDNKRAKLIGSKTFGKGLVQKIYPLPNSTGMNLTVAQYLTPNGHPINKVGIKPDYEVLLTKDDFIQGIDSQLQFAINYLNSILNPLE